MEASWAAVDSNGASQHVFGRVERFRERLHQQPANVIHVHTLGLEMAASQRDAEYIVESMREWC